MTPENSDGADAGSREYWLSVGAELIKGRVSRVDTAADKLTTAIGWFWTAYTASAVLGISFADRKLALWRLILAILPSVVLIIAYSVATEALMPEYAEFDPRLPDDIKAKQDAVAAAKEKKLNAAKALTWLGAALVAIAILAVASAPLSQTDSFAAAFDAEPGGGGRIVFSGRIHDGKDTPVTVAVTMSPAGVGSPEPIMLIASGTGDFHGVFTGLEPGAYEVQASWTIGELTRTASIKVKSD